MVTLEVMALAVVVALLFGALWINASHKVSVYRHAIIQARTRGANIPQVIQLADAVNFPEAR